MTATSWLVYRLTGSALLLGVVGFAGQFPTFVLGPFAGIMVDRWDRHRLLVLTQTLSMAQSFALAALTLTGQITITHIILLNLVQGVVNAFDMPARQAFVIQLIENKADLGNAIALNSSMVNAAAAGRAVDRRDGHRRHRRRLVLHDRRLQLPGRHCRAAAHADRARPRSRCARKPAR